MIVGKYIGEKASLAKDKVSKELLDSKHALMIHVILNPPVHCRCGANIVVNIIRTSGLSITENQNGKTS